jgi:hypothetical protein
MKSFRFHFFLLLFLILPAAFPQYLDARPASIGISLNPFNAIIYAPRIFFNFGTVSAGGGYHCASSENGELTIVKKPSDGGIREIIPVKYKQRYQKWKDELLSTEFGRRQWENYLNNQHFVLTITIESKEGQGAGTGQYQWAETGELVGATITLGTKIDKGLPSPIYFPVMNSLSSNEPAYTVSGNILAATKFAHEFGHVNQTAKMKSDFFQLQNKLIPVYNEILLKNGYNANDQNLIELQKQMGGTPVEIWENREYWGEANAMLYLADRINKESYHCSVVSKMIRNVRLYARHYEERFEQIAEAKDFESVCGKN